MKYLYELNVTLIYASARDISGRNLTSKQRGSFVGTGLLLSLGSLSTPVSRKTKLHVAGSLLILSGPLPSFVSHMRSRHSKSKL